ncbi:hypothetical protein [Planctomyces sp. SH-PL14]|uniref:hypothetical protein n=1 Tax=Planctomyces sp. SH-PL14 TaxID=1632864 RepID=UPI00078DC6A9|nr:hypothetical protein [Planctomyces sp. SH-PL14]AMV20405.1 hypothetical protein VT03_21080 [Planctomyces sp. SH-PL14]
MAILWIKELFRYTGKFSLQQEDLTRVFHIYSDAIDEDDPTDVRAALEATGVSRGATHPKSTAWCREVSVNPNADRDKGLFVATASYSNGPLSQREEDKIAFRNPLDRPTIMEGNRVAQVYVPPVDRYGKAYQNAANVPLDPPPAIEISRLQLSFRKNFDNVPDWWFSRATSWTGLGDCINESSIFVGHSLQRVFPRRSARLIPISISEQLTENDYSFVEVRWMLDIITGYRILRLGEVAGPEAEVDGETVVMSLDEQKSGDTWTDVTAEHFIDSFADVGKYRRAINWDTEFANVGMDYLDAGTDDLVPFMFGNRRVSTPQWLSPEGGNTVELNSDTEKPEPNYIYRGNYPLADFAPIEVLVG